jgi:hypothetical protein
MRIKNKKLKTYVALIGLTFWFGSFLAQGAVVQIGTLVDPDNVVINNTTPPLFIEVGSLVVDGVTYVRDETIFTGNSGVPKDANGDPLDPNQDPLLLTTTLDDGVNNNSITGLDSWNINNGGGRRSFSADPEDQAGRPPWETRNFGGQATFTSTNGDGPDFIILENGANDDLFVQAVLTDGTTGQYTPFIVGNEAQIAKWGDTGLLRLKNNQSIVGVAWKVEDLLGADGNPLSPDTEILALRFNDPTTSPDTGLDPLLLVAVIQPQGLSQVGTMVDPDNVIINNITPPLFMEVGSIPIVGNRTYVRDVDIFTGTSGVPTNPDGTPVDPAVTFELLTTTVDDGVNNNSITAQDEWNLVPTAGRRSFSDDPEDQAGRPAWQTGNFGGQETFTSTNDDGPDFILFENAANDDLTVQAVFPDGTTGQWTGLIVGDEAQAALWGDTGLVQPGTAVGAGQGKFGVGFRVEHLLGADGNPLPQDTEIWALRFNDPTTSPDTGLDPCLLVAVIIGVDDPTPRAEATDAGSTTIATTGTLPPEAVVGNLVFLDDGTELGKIASIAGNVLTLEAALAAAIAADSRLTFVVDNTGGGEPATGGKLVNISTRGVVGTGDDVLIGGFVIGTDRQQVYISATGPELGNSGVTGFLVDPVLTVTNIATGEETVNDNWEDTQAQLITDLWGGAPPLGAGSLSAALVMTLDTGSYTAKITGAGDTTGIAIIEAFEID